jgi:hypothetical protein
MRDDDRPTDWASAFDRWVMRMYVWGPALKPARQVPLPEQPPAPDRQRRLLFVAGIVLGALAPLAVAVALVPLRGSVEPSTVALVLVVPVVLVVAATGLVPGLVASLSAAIAFDVLHTQPYSSLTIHARADAEVAGALALTAVCVAAVVSNQLTARTRASLRRGALAELEVVASVAASGTVDATVAACTAAITRVLRLQQCRWAPGYHGAAGYRLTRAGAVTGSEGDRSVLPHDVELPVELRGEELGRLILRTTPGEVVSREERQTAVAVADILAVRLATG